MRASPASGRAAPLLRALTRVDLFSRLVLGKPLRGYQVGPAQAIVDSVLRGAGLTLAVMMSRQAGKNETSAHVEALLLNLHRRRGGYLVKAAPTFRPQCVHSIMRLSGVLAASPLPAPTLERGYMLRVGRARAAFYSAGARANIVGATASILLEGDEAQDIAEDKWNKDLAPMGASTNVTTVLWGTAWTSSTFLAHTVRALRWAEARDGIRRVFVVPWERVAAEVPAYGRYVRGEIARLGRQHPLIRTQYYLEEIDDAARMFPPATRALMQGSHARQRQPTEGRRYALLIDVAGEAEESLEGAALAALEPRRDHTALTVVELAPGDLGLPRFLVVDRYLWTGTPHHRLYGAICHLADLWAVAHVVVDATGVGAGLASFLKQALGGRVLPFAFSAASKSELGWAFLGVCSSGRFLDHRDDGSPERHQFWRQVEAAELQVVDAASKRARWGVADAALHDDLLVSAALCALLDQPQGAPAAGAQIIEAGDVLRGEGGEGCR